MITPTAPQTVAASRTLATNPTELARTTTTQAPIAMKAALPIEKSPACPVRRFVGMAMMEATSAVATTFR